MSKQSVVDQVRLQEGGSTATSMDKEEATTMSAYDLPLSRRDFLKLGSLMGGAFLLDGSLRAFVPAPVGAAGEDEILYGACSMCDMGCAYIAHLRDGRIVRLTGNPLDQEAQGKLCVKGHSGTRLLYDPDRLKYPMKRTNPDKGVGADPGWTRISWDEALDLTANKLNQVREAHGPQAIMVVSRAKDWSKLLAGAIGTPNLVSHENTCLSSQAVAWDAMITGDGKKWTVDYERAKYILSFGWDQPGKANNHWGRAVNLARLNGARLVVLDPRMSITAAKADEWIPIKPGTDLAFALAMIHVIINEDLYDHEFVDNYTYGFDKLKEAVQGYTPEWAAHWCDVPAEKIARVAREFGVTKPAVVASHKRDAGGPNYANSSRVSQCYITLNALAGTIDRPGGPILTRSFELPGFSDVFDVPPFPDTVNGPRIDGLNRIPIAYKLHYGSFCTVAEGILSQNPYPVKAAVVWHYNLLAFPDAPRMREALKTLDFVAVSDIMPSEMAQMADVVLPEGTYFEGSGLSPRSLHALYPQVALREALPAVHDTKSFGSCVVELLRRMGLEDYAPKGMGGAAITEAQLKTLGTTAKEIRAAGGLWGKETPFKPKTHFNTPSGKVELYATLFEKQGYDPLPLWEPPRATVNEEYPFHLVIFRLPWYHHTTNENDPVLAELPPRDPPAYLNRSRAATLGIADGDEVYVESRAGKIKLKAKLTEGIRPDCVAVLHGFGHWSPGYSVAQGRGANDGELIPDMTIQEQLSLRLPGAASLMEDVALKIYKA
jgi:thiosulfate reductase/polysulfide reductase chain A